MLLNQVNHTPSKSNSQQNNYNYLNKYLDIVLSYLSRSRINALDLISDMYFRYKTLRPSQTFIANRFGYARETINRAIAELEFFGLIEKTPQAHKKMGFTCIYKLASFITKELCKKFSHFFKSFRFFSVKYLCSRSIGCFSQKNVTLVNSSYYNIYITTPVSLVPREYKVNLREKEDEERGKNISDRKERMKDEDKDINTETIQRAERLIEGLALHGKLKLRAFEDEALNESLTKYNTTPNIRSPFEFVISEAVKYSQQNRLPINWRRYYFLRDSYNIPADDRNFVTQQKNSLKGNGMQKFIPKRGTSEYERPIDPEREAYGRKSNELAEQRRIEFEAREAKREAYLKEREDKDKKTREKELLEEILKIKTRNIVPAPAQKNICEAKDDRNPEDPKSLPF
jgi:hypothetical protein